VVRLPRGSLGVVAGAGCGHPFGVPALVRAGAWGVARAGSGVNQRHGRAAGGGGQTCGRSRAARVRACSGGIVDSGRGVFDSGPGGQGSRLPVAQRVEDAGEQVAGRGGLGDVARWGAAAGGPCNRRKGADDIPV
jgi:hypothetical protein